jgi:hypothetical protein
LAFDYRLTGEGGKRELRGRVIEGQKVQAKKRENKEKVILQLALYYVHPAFFSLQKRERDTLLDMSLYSLSF